MPDWAIGTYRVYKESYGSYLTGDYILEISYNNLVYEGTNTRGEYEYFNLADYMSDPDIFIKNQHTNESWYKEYYLDLYDYTDNIEKISNIRISKYPASDDMGDLFIRFDDIKGYDMNLKFVRID